MGDVEEYRYNTAPDTIGILIANTLLNQDFQECNKKAKYEGHDPKSIKMDVRCQWVNSERGWPNVVGLVGVASAAHALA